ncbi:MAG TPA: glycogen synthase GlgA [Thermoanaerobaculia bacterium]|nr:glycogen synthase GlgA [Thermoanaerobaculia bacterium]
MRVLFATSEVSPIAKTGGLGDVCGSLPKALRALGHELVVFMPYHRQARQWLTKNGVELEHVVSAPMSWANWTADLTLLRTTLPDTDIPLYLAANDYFFDRDWIYAHRPDGFDDSVERFAWFCRAVIRGAELIEFAPEIIHAHDWHTALLAVYLDSGLRDSETFRDARSVYTIHNLNYQGHGTREKFDFLGLHSRYWSPDAVEHFNDLNLMKGGILLADQVTTVSPNYARETRTPEGGVGLDGVMRDVGSKYTGILNGIDVDEWNPAADEHLPANFEPGKLHGKTICKRMLTKELGLKYKPKTPLIGIVSRLVDQKGFQLVLPVLSKIVRAGAQLIILGTGELHYEQLLQEAAAAHRDTLRVIIGFDNALAHRIYAACDLLLMPSMWEPCGLNQMYALHYGTLPIVRMTGGLADTVTPFDGTNRSEATGFGFIPPTPHELYTATWIAMLNFKDSRLWKTLQANGMDIDFSWARSAKQYDEVYKRAHAT